MMKRICVVLFLVVFSTVSLSCKEMTSDVQLRLRDAFVESSGKYALYISKKDFKMSVYNRQGEVVAEYKIGYGLNPDKKTKLHAGDNRTPEGTYYITEILSMDAPKDSSSYRKLRAMNSVYFRARDGHYRYGKPDQDLGDNAYGPRFFRISYPNMDDRKRYEKAKSDGKLPLKNGRVPSIGSGIAIHGNCDPGSVGHLSSSGCIRMYNKDIVDLEKYVQRGTPVIIDP